MSLVLHQNVVQPPTSTPIFTPGGQPPSQLWASFFQSLVSAAAPIEELMPDPSPWVYTALFPGNVLIRGGIVSALALARSRMVIDPLGVTGGFVPVMPGDELTVTYTGLPDAWFLPNMGGVNGP